MTTPSPARTIAVLTSGGDAPGMNAAVRAVVRTALARGQRVFAIREGYEGAVDGGDRIVPMTWSSVGGILHLGGTVIGTARSERFRARDGRLQAARHLLQAGIDSLVVIGGDGSLSGAAVLRQEWPSLVEELVASGQVEREAGGERSPAQHRRARRLDRQRHGGHRHHDRRRHGAAPHHRGDRRDRLHRGQPPAHLRGRGDGPPLRLPGADGRHRHRREHGADPREPARRGRLGRADGRAPAQRARGRAPRLDRDRGRGRARPPRQPDQRRARAPGARASGSTRTCA